MHLRPPARLRRGYENRAAAGNVVRDEPGPEVHDVEAAPRRGFPGRDALRRGRCEIQHRTHDGQEAQYDEPSPVGSDRRRRNSRRGDRDLADGRPVRRAAELPRPWLGRHRFARERPEARRDGRRSEARWELGPTCSRASTPAKNSCSRRSTSTGAASRGGPASLPFDPRGFDAHQRAPHRRRRRD